MCLECFVEYCRNALSSRGFKEHRHYGYTLQCPGMCVYMYVSGGSKGGNQPPGN